MAAPQVVEVFKAAAADGEPVHFHNSEFMGLKDRPAVLPGEISRWDSSIWPLKNSAGAVTHLLVSGIDVTGPELDRTRPNGLMRKGYGPCSRSQ